MTLSWKLPVVGAVRLRHERRRIESERVGAKAPGREALIVALLAAVLAAAVAIPSAHAQVPQLIIDDTGDGLGRDFWAPYGAAADPGGFAAYFPANLTDYVFKVLPGGAITTILDGTGDGDAQEQRELPAHGPAVASGPSVAHDGDPIRVSPNRWSRISTKRLRSTTSPAPWLLRGRDSIRPPSRASW